MAISRPLLLALIAALLAVGTFYAALGARDSSSSEKSVSSLPVPVEVKQSPRELSAPKQLESAASRSGSSKSKQVAGERDRTGEKGAPKTSEAKGAEAIRAKAERARPARAAKPGLPAPVARAFARNDVVVLFFRQRRGADDSATADSVAAVRNIKGVSVITDRQERLPRYRRVIESLGINQAPAVVLVDRKRQARLVEGFVDPASLRQQVLDLR